MTLRVGIVGAGKIGTSHARTIASRMPGARVTAIADVFEDVAQGLAAEVGAEIAVADALELVSHDDVDAVIACTPAETHEDLVLTCIEWGKPILCEKPLADTADACMRLVQAEAGAGRRLVTVGFMRRFDPAYLELHAALRDGGAGMPLMIHNAHRSRGTRGPGIESDPASWLIDGAVHEVDVCRWLLQDEITEVAVHSRHPAGEPEMPILLTLTSSKGLLCTIELFGASYAYDIRCEVVAEFGTVELAQRPGAILRREGVSSEKLPSRFQERFERAYAAELQSWIGGIVAGTSSGSSAWDGYAATLVCETLVRSLHSGSPQKVDIMPRPSLYASAWGGP